MARASESCAPTVAGRVCVFSHLRGAESVLETALLFARRFGSYVEAVSTLPVIDNYIVGEMVPLWPPNQRHRKTSSRT